MARAEENDDDESPITDLAKQIPPDQTTISLGKFCIQAVHSVWSY